LTDNAGQDNDRQELQGLYNDGLKRQKIEETTHNTQNNAVIKQADQLPQR